MLTTLRPRCRLILATTFLAIGLAQCRVGLRLVHVLYSVIVFLGASHACGSKRALADENIAECRFGLFRRDGEHIGAGLGSDPERLRRSHEVVVGIDDIDTGQLVAVPLEDSLDGEPAYLQTKPGIFFEQVARCAAERARIRAARVCKFKGEIEEAGVLRRCKPPAGVAARRGQIQKDLLRVAAGIFLDDRPERGEAS